MNGEPEEILPGRWNIGQERAQAAVGLEYVARPARRH
jgi:hypothetical protein